MFLNVAGYRFYIATLFAWYDLWVGVFVDRKGQRIYILPVPCIGVCVSWLKL